MSAVTIERIVLTNVALKPADADAFRGAIARELGRLIVERGMPAASKTSPEIATPDGSPAAIASSIYEALGGARS